MRGRGPKPGFRLLRGDARRGAGRDEGLRLGRRGEAEGGPKGKLRPAPPEIPRVPGTIVSVALQWSSHFLQIPMGASFSFPLTPSQLTVSQKCWRVLTSVEISQRVGEFWTGF